MLRPHSISWLYIDHGSIVMEWWSSRVTTLIAVTVLLLAFVAWLVAGSHTCNIAFVQCLFSFAGHFVKRSKLDFICQLVQVQFLWHFLTIYFDLCRVYCNIYFLLNKIDPQTAVLSASMTVHPICPCLYSEFLWLWCHNITSYREKDVYKIAQLPIGQYLFTL